MLKRKIEGRRSKRSEKQETERIKGKDEMDGESGKRIERN